MLRPLTLIVKTCSSCNMACRYCDADIYSHKRLEFPVLAHLTAKALRSSSSVHFVWHGGEPLLLGKDFFRKAHWLQQEYRRKGQAVSNAIQTNGTLLDSTWLDLFDSLEFSVGLSIDGPAVVHDANRVFKNERGTFAKVMRAIALLKERNRHFGVLAVVTDETVALGPRRFYDFFVESGLKQFGILCQRPAIIKGEDSHMSRHSHSRFVRDIFDIWLEQDDPEVSVRDFESIMRALLGGEHSTCLLAGGCIGQYFAIDTEGAIFHCDEFMNDIRYRIGKTLDVRDFASLDDSAGLAALTVENEMEISELDCPWLHICNGGCPKDRYVSRMFSPGRPIACCGYADLIEHIYRRMSTETGLGRALSLTRQHETIAA